jgi:alpha-mannosidase
MKHSTRWTDHKISQRLALIELLSYRRSQLLEPFRYRRLAGPLPPAPADVDAPDDQWSAVPPGEPWSDWRTNFILRGSFQAPQDWDANAPMALAFNLGGRPGDFMGGAEALVYVVGVAHAGYDVNHRELLLPPEWRSGQVHQLMLHGWTGNGGFFGQPGSRPIMGLSRVVQIDQPTRDFIASARVALGVAETLDASNPTRMLLLNTLDEAFRILDTCEPMAEAFYASVAPAHAVLRAGIAAAGPPLDVQLSSTGHAHIDVAWLWTLGQTHDKASRSWYSVLRLMEQFPTYQFTQSQPQLYDYVRQDHPALFEAIKQRVAEGRWEITGDMWVEADCNLSGAESLARQFLLGRSFFRTHFGAGRSSGVVWLPDVFGYAWALPQLIKHADLDYFFTIKIGWSQYNRLPYQKSARGLPSLGDR